VQGLGFKVEGRIGSMSQGRNTGRKVATLYGFVCNEGSRARFGVIGRIL
jgi:hypothetical protein